MTDTREFQMKTSAYIRIKEGPWRGTMIRFATPEQVRLVKRASQSYGMPAWKLLDTALCAQFPECLNPK